MQISNQSEQPHEEQELFKYKNYSIRKLIPQYRDQVLQTLTQEFVDQEPLSVGFWKQFPVSQQQKEQFWRQFYGKFMDYTINQGLGVVAIDISNNEQFAGVAISRDLTYFCEDLHKKLVNDVDGFGKPVCEVEDYMIERVTPEYRQLLKKPDTVLNTWGVAIKKNHMGKQLLHQMILGTEILGKKKGFKYGYLFASNIRTQKAGVKIGYQKISECNTHELKVDGRKPFALVSAQSQFSTLWIKKLE